MKQAIHIFKKDVRYLRFEICLVVVLAGALPGLALPWPWAIAAAFLIARVIHAEAIPGDNQFWITRPYRRTSLMAAKLLFIGAFINLPFFLVQLYLLIRYEHLSTATWPGLLWSQVLMVLCLSLPAAALAAMTPGMVAYGLLELIVAAAVYSLGQFSPTSSRIPWPSGVEWISNSLMISMAALAAILILTLQFHRRKTWPSRAVALVATLVCVSIFQFLPPQFALNAETHLTRPSIETQSLKLSGTPDSIRVNMVTQYGRSSKPQLILPVEITGVPTDVDIKADSFSGTFQGSGGRTSTVFTKGADIKLDSSGKWIANATFFVDPAFYRTQRDETVTLHASLYFSMFGDARSQTIPQEPETRTVLDRFRCSTAEFEKLIQFGCIAAFRWPGQMVYAQTSTKDPIPFFLGISYSPFPAELSLTPFVFHSALTTQGLAPPSPLGEKSAPAVTISAKRALAHVQRDFEVTGIRFKDLLGPREQRFPSRKTN